MLELDTTIMTLADVLKTSGHVDKFADWMCKDTKNGEIFRADHLVEGVLEARLEGDKQARAKEAGETIAVPAEAAGGDDKKSKKKKVKSSAIKLDDALVAEYTSTLAQIDNFDGKQLGELIRKYDIRSPESGNEVSEPIEFNLMFESSIGPTGQVKGYLRPETAQGHFVNFQRLLEFNNGRVPLPVLRSASRSVTRSAHVLVCCECVNSPWPRSSTLSTPRTRTTSDSKRSRTSKCLCSQGCAGVWQDRHHHHDHRRGGLGWHHRHQTLGYFIGRIYLFLSRSASTLRDCASVST